MNEFNLFQSQESGDNKNLFNDNLIEFINIEENDIHENRNYKISKEPKNVSNESSHTLFKNDKKLSTLFKEDKDTIKTFHSQKSERLVKYIRKKRDITLQRIAEDFDLVEKRMKEDIKMEEDLRIIKLEEEVERRALNEKLHFKFPDKSSNKESIPLKEESDEDDAKEGNNRKKNLKK